MITHIHIQADKQTSFCRIGFKILCKDTIFVKRPQVHARTHKHASQKMIFRTQGALKREDSLKSPGRFFDDYNTLYLIYEKVKMAYFSSASVDGKNERYTKNFI